MSIRNLTCVEITCDDCNDDCFEDGTPHFDSPGKAMASGWFSEWLFTETEQVCGDCHANRVCASEGHSWGNWWLPPKGGVAVYRSCERCRSMDYTVAVQAGGVP